MFTPRWGRALAVPCSFGIVAFLNIVASGQTLSSAPSSNLGTDALTLNWSSTFPGGTLYYAQLSTNASFAAPVLSSNTLNISATYSGLTPNTTYYARVATAPAGPFTALGSTVTLIQPPTSVYFDEVSSHSIVAAAYAPAPAFSNLNAGLSGTNIAIGGVYAGWHGEAWVTKAAMSGARYGLGAAAAGGKLYAVGGYNASPLTTNAEYDPVSNAWTAKTALPAAANAPGVTAAEGSVYLAGGEDAGGLLATMRRYDPGSNSWTSLAAMPSSRAGHAFFHINGRLHSVGGIVGPVYTDSNVSFDPRTGAWTSRGALPFLNHAMGAAVSRSMAYLVGGSNGATLSSAAVYNTGSDSWVSVSSAPVASANPTLAAVGGKLYLIGGQSGGGAALSLNHEYDPVTDAWTPRASMPTARHRAGAAVVGGRVYVVGGTNGSALSVNEQYDPGTAWSFAGLSPNTQYSFKAKARNLSGVETDETSTVSTYTWAAVPLAATPTFTGVFIDSVAVAWTANGNPGGTEYRLQASTASDFNGSASSTTSSWTAALSATASGLASWTNWHFRVHARNAVGVETAYAALGSTATLLPGTLKVWDGGGATNLASEAANWVGDAAPAAGDSVWFGPASAKDCTWNSVVSLASMTLAAGYEGTVTLSTNVTVGGDLTVSSGTLVAPAGGTVVTVLGRLVRNVPSSIVYNTGRLRLAGDLVLNAVNTTAVWGSTVEFNGSAYQVVYGTGSGVLPALDVNSSSKVYFNRQGGGVSFTGGVFLRSGVLDLGGQMMFETYGPWVQTGGQFTAAQSTVIFYGASSSAPWTVTALPGNPFYNLRIGALPQNSFPGHLRAAVPLDVDGSVIISSGSFDPGPFAHTVGGDWQHIGGEFIASTGTVRLDGAAATRVILASGGRFSALDVVKSATTTFTAGVSVSSLSFSQSAGTLSFQAGSTATVGRLILGAPGLAQRLTLRSTSSGAPWRLVVQSTAAVWRAAVSDSDASGGLTVRARLGDSLDGGGNVNWEFDSVSPGALSGVSTGTLSASWTSTFPGGTLYLLQASTAASFAAPLLSSATAALAATFAGLSANTTYHVRVAADPSGPFVSLGSTHTWVQAPTAVYFDEVTTHSIVASAYAPTPAFANLGAGQSGTNVAKDGVYAGWHGERWTTKAAMPSARYGVRAAAVNGRIYVLGGYNAGNLATNAEYDPAADAWVAKTAMPTARHSFAIGVLHGKIFAMGGESTSVLTTNQEYDPTTNAWTTKAPLPSGRVQVPTVAVDGKLHLFGGMNGTVDIGLHDAYNPLTDAWENKTSLPDARQGPAAELVGGKAYVLGGGGTSNSVFAFNREFDFATNAWVTKSTMPTPRSIMAHGTIGGKIYAVAGKNGPSPPGTAVSEEYDPAADTWTVRAPAPTVREWVASAVVAGRLYVIGGSNGTPLAVNEEYDPGVARRFAGLQPNTQYAFKAKARNQGGLETAETADFSTYTLAALPMTATPTFTAVNAGSVTVQWLSGGNPGGTEYLLQASTASDFTAVAAASGWTASLSAALAPLPSQTLLHFRVQARNGAAVPTAWTTLGSTQTLPEVPLSSGGFSGVSTGSLSYAWGSPFPGGTQYHAQVASHSAFAGGIYSSSTLNLWASFTGLTPNTTYFIRVGTAPTGPFAFLDSTHTWVQAPTAVYFDEVTTHSLVAAAYAPTPAFSNLHAGLSATNVAKDGVYAGWHGERWTTKAAMPTARYGLQAAAVNGRLYAIGGYNGISQSANAEYDPISNTWTAKAAMPTARHSFALAALGGKLYAAGGENTAVLTTHQAYDPATDTWTSKASLPSGRTQASAAAYDGKIHVFGGFNTVNLNLQDAYDPATDAWQSRPGMPDARNSMGVDVIDGKAYLVGGEAATLLAYTRTFDFAANSFATRSTMAAGRGIFAHGVIGGKIYALGGRNGGSTWTGASEEYDPASDAWTERAPMPTPRRWMGSAVIAGRLYAVGGSSDTTQAVNEQYDPGTATHFTGLSPNTQYSFKAKARNQGGLETAETASFSTYTLAAVPGALAVSFVGTSSASLQWTAAGNPGGTEFQAELAVSSSFASASTTAWTADMLSAVFTGLSPGTTYFARARARNALGVPTGYTSSLNTRTPFADLPGCAVSRFVAKDGSGDCTRIQACVDLVPSTPLAGDFCIAVLDSAVYSEQVTVAGKDPNGSRIRLWGAGGARPTVTPPAGSSAGFRLLTASVSVADINVVTTNTVTYGVLAASASVSLSSMIVDSGGRINGAGVFLSSWGAVVNASVTVQNADGFRLTGLANSVSASSASVTVFARAAFYLGGASSNTVSDSYGSGNPGYGAYVFRSHGNTFARTTLRKLSATAGAAGLYLNDASSNTITGCFISNAGGPGADLSSSVNYNVIELSTVTAAGNVYTALQLGSGRGNRVSGVYAYSAWGNASTLSSGMSETLVENSTFSTAYTGANALSTNGSSETLVGNMLYAPNGIGLGLYGSSVTVLRNAAFTAASSFPALYVAGGGYVTVRDSSFENSAGDGGKLERAAYVDILRSTVTGAAGGAGLRLEGSSSNTVAASRLAAPGGVGLAVGSYLELFDMTTTTGSGNVFSGLSVSGSTAVSLGAAPGLELSSSVLTGDSQGSAIAFGDAVLVATFTGLAFPSGAAMSAEATLLPAGSRITIRDSSGPQAGSLYENDPLSLVDWVPDLVPFVLPPAPAAPSGTVLGTSSISWNWSPVAGAQSYRVYSSSSGSLLATSASTGVVVTDLLPATTNSVVVAGVARGESGPLSPSATAHTHATPPSGLALDVLYVSSAALSWSLEDNPGQTLAELQRSTDGTAYAVRAGTLATSAEDTGLIGCTSYYYRVRHKSPAGVGSAFDGPLLVRTPASTPSAPGDLSAQSVPGRRVSLTWSGSLTEGVVAYRLYKDTGAGTVDYSAPYATFGATTFSTTTVALSSGAVHLFGLRALHRCGIEEPNTHAVASAWALESLDGVRASIKVPSTGKKISGNRVLVMAELDTGDARDVSSILFQYRSTGTAAWTDIPAANANHPNPDREQPFFVHWDVTGLADRAYDLRAVASDVVGASDPAPGAITVLVDSVGFEVRETDLGAGRVKKEQAVSNETSNTVAAAGSGSAVVTKVILPAGALNTSDATLSATPNPAALPAPPPAATSLGASIEITLSNGQSQLSNGQTAAIVFNYPDDDGDGVIDGTLVRAENAEIQVFDVPSGQWKKEFATTVDRAARTLTGRTPHFSLFAAFGVVTTGLDQIRVYPNPYKPNAGNPDEGRTFSRADPLSGVVFDNLPAVVDIKIYTLTGRLVSSFGTTAGTGAVQWDGKNDNGEDVASGGYFAVITSPGQKTVIKKLAVIR